MFCAEGPSFDPGHLYLVLGKLQVENLGCCFQSVKTVDGLRV